MKKSLLLLVCLSTLLRAQVPHTASTAMPFLNFIPDARSAGMGGVYYGRTDVNVGFNAVAKLVSLVDEPTQVGVSYTPLKNVAHNAYLSSAAFVARNEQGALFVGLRYFTPGSVVLADGNANYLGTVEPSDMVVQLGYALPLSPDWSISVTGGWAYSKLLDGTYNGTTYLTGSAVMADIACCYDGRDIFHQGFSGGLALKNIGTPVSYTKETKSFLPASATVGVAYTAVGPGSVTGFTIGTLIGKVLIPANDTTGHTSMIQGLLHPAGEVTYAIGAEYLYNFAVQKMNLSVRAGYSGGTTSTGGVTAGIGYGFNSIAIDVAYRASNVYDPFGNTFRIGLGYKF